MQELKYGRQALYRLYSNPDFFLVFITLFGIYSARLTQRDLTSSSY